MTSRRTVILAAVAVAAAFVEIADYPGSAGFGTCLSVVPVL